MLKIEDRDYFEELIDSREAFGCSIESMCHSITSLPCFDYQYEVCTKYNRGCVVYDTSNVEDIGQEV